MQNAWIMHCDFFARAGLGAIGRGGALRIFRLGHSGWEWKAGGFDFSPATDMTPICGGDFRGGFRISPMRKTHGVEVLGFFGEVLMYRNPTCAAMFVSLVVCDW